LYEEVVRAPFARYPADCFDEAPERSGVLTGTEHDVGALALGEGVHEAEKDRQRLGGRRRTGHAWVARNPLHKPHVPRAVEPAHNDVYPCDDREPLRTLKDHLGGRGKVALRPPRDERRVFGVEGDGAYLHGFPEMSYLMHM